MTRPVRPARIALPVRRGALFWITGPFVGRVRRETPARFHYWKCILGASLPPALLSGWWVVSIINCTPVANWTFIAPAAALVLCGGSVWKALNHLVFDSDAREARKLLKQGLVLPAPPPDCTRAAYRRDQIKILLKAMLGLPASAVAYVVVPPLVEQLPLIGRTNENHLIAQMSAAALGLYAICIMAGAASNLLFGGFELERERAIRACDWTGEQP